MLMMISLLFLTSLEPLPREITFRAFPRPMDFQEGKVSAYLSSIHQVESDGQRLYFRSMRGSLILITNLEGETQKVLGGAGEHPSEFGASGVLAMAVSGKVVSALDGGLRFIRFYENDRYASYLRPRTYNARAIHSTSNIYAFSKEHVVVPALGPDHLAIVYPRDGSETREIGELLEIGSDWESEIERNATLWCFQDGLWYAAHKFFPMVTVFDERFQRVNQFQIQHPLTDRYIAYLSEFKPNERFTKTQVLVSDFKFFRGSLYLMLQGELFGVDPQTGAIRSVTHFFAKGEDFGAADGHKITLPFFAFGNDGTLFAVHPALLWNHDFWSVRLPFLQDSATGKF